MGDIHLWPVTQCLVLLAAANGAPVIAKRLLGDWLAQPIDGGRRLRDGQPLLGPSKTFRGLVLAIGASAAAAVALGLDIRVGAVAGSCAMAGDLASSFLKRRLQLPSSAMAPGLDQVPESLLPFLVVKGVLGLSIADVLIGVGLFWVGELAVSRVLYLLRIRDRPY